MKELSKEKSNGNYLRVERIETLMKRENFKYAQDFADRIDILPQNFSRAMQSGKISEKMCQKIIKAFPNYRIEWLLGYDEIPTRSDQFKSVLSNAQKEADLRGSAIRSLLDLLGFSIEAVNPANDPTAESLITAMKDGFTIERDGKSVSMSLFDFIDFENEIAGYVDFRLSRMMK